MSVRDIVMAAAGAKSYKTIQYVGGGAIGQYGTYNLPWSYGIPSLTGGIASAPAAGDLVLIFYGVNCGGGTPTNQPSASGYSQAVYVNNNPSLMFVGYKFMPSTPDTSITFTGTGAGANASATAIHVFRNVDTVTVLDVLTTSATGSGSARPNPPAITPITPGSYIVAGGTTAVSASSATLSSSDLSNFKSGYGSDTYDCVTGAGYNQWVSGTFDPAQFTNTITQSVNWCAATVALRPASN